MAPKQLKNLRPAVRRATIVDMVEKNGRATVEELALVLGASQETVRRDLNSLATAGQIRKVHGGAVRVEAEQQEGSFGERLKKNLPAKHSVAEKVAKIVKPGQSVMIDTGSATLVCAEALTRIRDLTVITNSTKIAALIASAENGSKAILLGGSYRHDNAQTVGAQTCAEISRIRTDHTILTVYALDQHGAYDYSEEEARVAQSMVDYANELTIVADLSKLGRSSTFKICDLDKVNRLVMEDTPTGSIYDQLLAAGVDIL